MIDKVIKANHTFPSYLTEPAYSKRTLYLSVYKSSVLGGNFGELAKKALDESLTLANKYLGGSFETKRVPMGDTFLTTIALPLPNELQDTTTHQWSAEKGVASLLADNVGLNSGMPATILARLADKTNARKPLIDPGYFQNYTGTEPRNFTFSFDFIPNSAQEANDILKIITLIRQYSTPTEQLSLGLISAPHYFKVNLSNNTLNNMINFQECVITNIDLNYSGSGFMDTTIDGVPRHIKMTISISERRMITHADWNSSKDYFNKKDGN